MQLYLLRKSLNAFLKQNKDIEIGQNGLDRNWLIVEAVFFLI